MNKKQINNILDLMSVNDKERFWSKVDIKPEQVEGYYEFYYYPDDRTLAVSRDSKVLNVKTGKILKGTIHKDNKVYIHISLGDGKTKAYLLHRLLARTFLGRPIRHLDKSYDELQVNHIDGNRLNNLLPNLEWCTGKENNEHSHANNFHPKDKQILVRNILTNEEMIFNSNKACADHFKIHRATFHKRLKTNRHGFKHNEYHINNLS